MDSLSNEDNAVVTDLREQIRRLETRLVGIESHGKLESVINEIPGYIEGDEVSSSAAQLGPDSDHLTNVHFTPEVRKCNFVEFKNRFSVEEARYAVDVLISGALFEQEYLEEQRLRDKLFEHGKSNPRAIKKGQRRLYTRRIGVTEPYTAIKQITPGFVEFGFKRPLYSRFSQGFRERAGQLDREPTTVLFALSSTFIHK